MRALLLILQVKVSVFFESILTKNCCVVNEMLDSSNSIYILKLELNQTNRKISYDLV